MGNWRLVAEQEFNEAIQEFLKDDEFADIGCVTGPGRSGAIASVYASHILKVPFIPYGQKKPINLGRLLIIDTATDSGKTLRKAGKKYEDSLPLIRAVYKESATDKVFFWYEETNPKPQFYKHEDLPFGFSLSKADECVKTIAIGWGISDATKFLTEEDKNRIEAMDHES